MQKENCYYLGKITRKHGLTGQVILVLDTDQLELYNKMESIFIEINGLLVPFFIEEQKWFKNTAKIIRLKNASESMIEQILGNEVYLPLSTLPKLTGNKFYYHEVIGFEIKDALNQSYGTIKSINDKTAQHFFSASYKGKQVIVPIIKEWILSVDRDQKVIQMNLPEGLLNVFTEPSVNDEA